jgi:predicted negative regulator of RcsB-dependent stress response
MTSPAPKVPWYKSQWFWIVALVMLGLRFGYKTWRQEQRPNAATRMEQLNERSRALEERIRASQAASTAPVVVADSALLADTATISR